MTDEHDAPPTGSAEPADDDGQLGPRHLLTRPVGVGRGELGRVGLDPLHPTAGIPEQLGDEVLDGSLVAGHAWRPDHANQVVDGPNRVDGIRRSPRDVGEVPGPPRISHEGSASSCTSVRLSR